jgi:hypothetical protein
MRGAGEIPGVNEAYHVEVVRQYGFGIDRPDGYTRSLSTREEKSRWAIHGLGRSVPIQSFSTRCLHLKILQLTSEIEFRSLLPRPHLETTRSAS